MVPPLRWMSSCSCSLETLDASLTRVVVRGPGGVTLVVDVEVVGATVVVVVTRLVVVDTTDVVVVDSAVVVVVPRVELVVGGTVVVVVPAPLAGVSAGFPVVGVTCANAAEAVRSGARNDRTIAMASSSEVVAPREPRRPIWSIPTCSRR